MNARTEADTAYVYDMMNADIETKISTWFESYKDNATLLDFYILVWIVL